MSDPLDEAAALTELLLKESLRKRAAVPDLTGACLTCDEPTTGAFCSKECREDYEQIEKLEKIRGKR